MSQTPAVKQKFPQNIFLQTLSGKPSAQIPFWLMRQAGRYLPEYRALRAKAGSFLNLCFDPESAAQVTLQPVERFGMDAAILFSDILVIPYALGQSLTFAEGEGPRLGALPSVENFAASDVFDEKLKPVYETVARVRKNLSAEKALIGFAGGPWTVACYMVQGRGDRDFAEVKKFAFSQPQEFDRLVSVLTDSTTRYLLGQIRAGADTVQIFDSWAGLLPQPYFDRWVIAPAQKIVSGIHAVYPGFPVIGFPRQAGVLYKSYAEKTGVAGIGIDTQFPVEEAVKSFGGKTAIQGNLDPALLLAGGRALQEGAERILQAAGQAPFIFNLGHGIIKETPPEHVEQLAKIIRAHKR